MDNKGGIDNEKMFQEGDFVFPFRKFEKMAEWMRSCCTGEGGMAEYCSMMKKMMRYGEGEKATKEKKDTGEAG
jgi:hypothetical protein